MNLSQLGIGFIKCPKCQKYSMVRESYFNLFKSGEKNDNQLAEWGCPYCFVILSEEEFKKNIILELQENFEEKRKKLSFGQILKFLPGEITPERAKDLAIEYIKKLKIDYPASAENIRVYDYNEEWGVDFDKIAPKSTILIPPTYSIRVNKKTGEAIDIF